MNLHFRSGAVVAVALTVAFSISAITLTALPPQAAPGQDRRAAAELFDGRDAVPGEVLVGFRGAPDLARLRADTDADNDEAVGRGRLRRIRSRSKDIRSLISLLSARSDVLYVEPNYIVRATNVPNEPRFPELWGLQNLGQLIGGLAGVPGADIGAASAWDVSVGSPNTLVGIVDTGIDYLHPDLAGNVWSAPASFTVVVGGQTITCAAGTHGFNTILKTCDPLDDHGHGTHVAGTIGAIGNNGLGVAGINWHTNLMGLKFLNSQGAGTLADAVNAIDFAIQAKAAFSAGGANVRVLSNSWSGGGFSQALLDAITRANENDLLFVAAAGNAATNNDLTPAYPSSYNAPNVVAVAATDNQDALAPFSNYGATSVDLGAPGVQVLSTVIGPAYVYFSGTSMATPHVSGAAALMLSHCTASTAAVKALLLNNVDPIPSLSGKTLTGGRLNIGRAIRACGPPGNTSPTVTLTEPSDAAVYLASGTVPLGATAGDAVGTVSRVAFYAGTALIGADTTPPFRFDWSAPVGNYTLVAVATDNDGASTTSNPVTIHVLPGSGSTPFGGTPHLVPGLIEAENFNDGGEGVGYHDLTSGNRGGGYRQTDVDIETTFDAGGGFAVGYISAGEWLAYGLFVTTPSVYTLDARVASAGVGGTFHVEIDGIDVTGIMAVPNTGNWQTWQLITHSGIPLTAGAHMLRIVIDTRGPTGWLGNLNYLRLTAPGVNGPPVVRVATPADGASYPAPATITVTATASDPDGSVAQVAFYAGTSLIGTDGIAPYAVNWSNVAVGDYSLTAVATDNAGASTTSGVVSVHVVAPPPPTPFGGSAAPIPGLIEAENFDNGGEGVAYHDTTAGNSGSQYRQTDVDIETTGDLGGGFSIGYMSAGEWLSYGLSATTASTYTLDVRVASGGVGGTFHVEVDGIDVTGVMAVPNTGGWQTFRTVTRSGIPLATGPHLLRVVIDTNGLTGWFGNLNYLRMTLSAGNNLPPVVQLTAPSDGASYMTPAAITVSATASDPDGSVAQVAFYSGSFLIGVTTTAPFSVVWNNVPVGNYTLTASATDNGGARTTSGVVSFQVVPATQLPFGETPAPIPGIVEAEDFDQGGEGIAYHDLTSGNSGGLYRQTDVDIETSLDAGGGYSLGWMKSGEWLEYTISVAADATYTLQARVASPGSGGTFHAEIDGVNVTGTLIVPSTGGWQTWQTVSRPGITLTAGAHLLRVVIDNNGSTGYFGNLNYLRWTAP